VYFIRKVLTETKARYMLVQKLLYAMLMATKNLQHYFTDHEVTVVTWFPLSEVVHSSDATGRISKWALELMGYDIRYVPLTAIKSRALADFMAEWTEVQTSTPDITHEYWTLYFDGSVMGPGMGAGVMLISPEGNKFPYAIHIYFLASNNVAEYEGLINGLCIAIEVEANWLYVYSDSKLVVDQVMKQSNCESSLMKAYCQEVRKLEDKFRGIKLHHVPRKMVA
jgi:ribonuclease HI